MLFAQMNPVFGLDSMGSYHPQYNAMGTLGSFGFGVHSTSGKTVFVASFWLNNLRFLCKIMLSPYPEVTLGTVECLICLLSWLFYGSNCPKWSFGGQNIVFNWIWSLHTELSLDTFGFPVACILLTTVWQLNKTSLNWFGLVWYCR